MFAELRRLQDFLSIPECHCDGLPHHGNRDKSPRNFKELVKILASFGLFIDEKQKKTVISKDVGDFIIDLKTGNVKFSPIICIRCNEQKNCKYFLRKLCIIEHSDGWANCSMSKTDLFILSKIFAILYNLLPNHVINQIKSLSDCFNKRSRIKALENYVLQEIRDGIGNQQATYLICPEAPPILGSIPPPKSQKQQLRFTPPPQEIKYNLENPNMIKLRCSILKELKNLQKLMELSKTLDNITN